MAEIDLPAFAELRRRFITLADDQTQPAVVQLGVAHRARGGAGEVLRYLAGLGIVVSTLDDLLAGISGLEDEEELAAFRCREGVAVSHASDGWWLLFTDDVAA